MNTLHAFRNVLACVINRYGVMLTAPAKALTREHPGEGDESDQSSSQTNWNMGQQQQEPRANEKLIQHSWDQDGDCIPDRA